jgi:hypothetical protein
MNSDDFQKVIAWTVDHRRLDGDETNLFAKQKSKRTPADTGKAVDQCRRLFLINSPFGELSLLCKGN